MTFASDHRSKLSRTRDSIFDLRHRASLIVSVSIFISYVGYYFLRSHFSVSITAIEAAGVLTKQEYGMVIGIAYASNVVGKTAGGVLVDLFNRPKIVFLLALLICGVITILNTYFISVNAFIILWCLARLFTSFGWGSVVKIVAAWWPAEHMGTMMGLAAVSCCLGEAITKITLGAFLSVFTWQQVYYTATAIALTLSLPTVFFVKDMPSDLSESVSEISDDYCVEKAASSQEPLLRNVSADSLTKPNPSKKQPDNLPLTDPNFFKRYSADGKSSRSPVMSSLSPTASPRHDSLPGFQKSGAEEGIPLPLLSIPSVDNSPRRDMYLSLNKQPAAPLTKCDSFLQEVCLPLLKSPQFLLILFMVLCTTILRETINNWFTVYLRDIGVSPDKAGMLSAIPSAFGGLSTLLGGWLVDKIPRSKRGLLAMAYLSAMTFFQIVLILFTKHSSPSWGVYTRASIATVLITATTFSMWAPYSFFDGVFIVDLIGQKGVAFGSGVVGATGYFGAFFTMMAFGRMVQTWEGWVNVWMITGAGSVVTVVACFFYWVFDRKA